MSIRRCFLAVALGATLVAPVAAGEEDVYAALKAFDGHWIATTAGGHAGRVDNNCTRTGLFFVCEQAVGGKPAALVVFLPKAQSGRRFVVHTQTLTAAGDRPGPWRELIVEGYHWTYRDLEKVARGRRRLRTVVSFSGPAFMHAETEASTDGERWSLVSAEDLGRAP